MLKYHGTMNTTSRQRRSAGSQRHAQMLRQAPHAAALLRALANEQRLAILCVLLDGPLSVGEINRQLPLSQSALSQHLAVLREHRTRGNAEAGADRVLTRCPTVRRARCSRFSSVSSAPNRTIYASIRHSAR